MVKKNNLIIGNNNNNGSDKIANKADQPIISQYTKLIQRANKPSSHKPPIAQSRHANPQSAMRKILPRTWLYINKLVIVLWFVFFLNVFCNSEISLQNSENRFSNLILKVQLKAIPEIKTAVFDLFCGDTNDCDWIASCFPLKEIKSKDKKTIETSPKQLDQIPI